MKIELLQGRHSPPEIRALGRQAFRCTFGLNNMHTVQGAVYTACAHFYTRNAAGACEFQVAVSFQVSVYHDS